VIDVETIVGSGPALFLVGLLLLIFGSLARERRVTILGAEMMLIVVSVLLLILLNRWGPRAAQIPVSVIACAQALGVAALTCVIIWRDPLLPAAVPLADPVRGERGA
jgi:hypothetical protein